MARSCSSFKIIRQKSAVTSKRSVVCKTTRLFLYKLTIAGELWEIVSHIFLTSQNAFSILLERYAPFEKASKVFHDRYCICLFHIKLSSVSVFPDKPGQWSYCNRKYD